MLRRIVAAWTVLVFASVAFAADLSSVNTNDVPQCGLLCIVNTVTQKSSCAITDFPCICSNAPLNKELEACFASQCSPRDALTTAKIAKDLCGAPKRNKKLAVWLVPLVTVIFSTGFYLLRLLSRAVLHQRIDIADIILGASVGLTFPVLWIAFKLGPLGLGEDVWEIPQDNITQILYLYWWAEILYQAGLPLTRISILCFYLRVFPQERIRWASFALIGLNLANFIAFVIATIFQCFPIYGAWTFWDGSFTGHCNNVHIQSWIQAGFNISLDLLVIILPLPPLANLTASKRKKVQILIMFSLGFLITIISILRLRTLVVFANSTNVSYDYVEPGLYSIIEASISIIICCLPAVRALMSTIMPNIFASTKNRSVFSSGNTPKSDSSRQKFNRLEDAYHSSDETRSPIGLKPQWSVHSDNVSKSESHVELMPMALSRTDTNVEAEQEERVSSPTKTLNWSRPLPRGRESGFA
ncbi:hypothetical protein F4859DRAFT_478987 [Xylaria cf. heliscus]|nr:hypothetical protein F4859DRAFT_478987 [Xylaria cf. heliscus]